MSHKSKSFTKFGPAIFGEVSTQIPTPWTNHDMHIYLVLVADDGRNQAEQPEMRCTRRSLSLVAAQGYQRTLKQFQQKPIEYKSDCRTIKDHHSQTGNGSIKWTMHWPASNKRKIGPDSATASLETIMRLVSSLWVYASFMLIIPLVVSSLWTNKDILKVMPLSPICRQLPR